MTLDEQWLKTNCAGITNAISKKNKSMAEGYVTNAKIILSKGERTTDEKELQIYKRNKKNFDNLLEQLGKLKDDEELQFGK